MFDIIKTEFLTLFCYLKISPLCSFSILTTKIDFLLSRWFETNPCITFVALLAKNLKWTLLENEGNGYFNHVFINFLKLFTNFFIYSYKKAHSNHNRPHANDSALKLLASTMKMTWF